MPNVSTETEVTHDDTQAQAEPTGSEDIEIAEEVTESDSSPIISVPLSTDDNDSPSEGPTRTDNVEIEEVFECDNSATDAPEPIITEQDEVSETSNGVQSDMVTEIPTVHELITNMCII